MPELGDVWTTVGCNGGQALFLPARECRSRGVCGPLARDWNGASSKQRLVTAGVESTEYYGMGGFYFPVHQFLSDEEREYILQHFIG